MGRLSKIQKAEIAAKQTEAARNLSEAVATATKVIIKESLYIALMADLWIVSGQVKIYRDGTTNKTIWAIQREAVIGMVESAHDIFNWTIPLLEVAPAKWAARLVEPWIIVLKEQEFVDGVPYYKKLDTSLRAIIVLMLPGMLRMMVNLTRQLIQLVK